jgi:dihydropteroate synthase
MKIGGTELDLSSPVVMAILNITPDSFYAASRRLEWSDGDIARVVDGMVESGAAIVDVGGYSSRPGAAEVSADEEFRRVARGIAAVRQRHPGIIVSVDTFRAEGGARAVEEFGKCIVNDISAGELDRDMIPTVARLGVPYIAMHMRGTPYDMQQHTDYEDITESVKGYFRAKLKELDDAGVHDIILDPGFGFAKSTAQNYELLGRLHELVDMGYPVLSGVSRKSMIYKVLGCDPADTLAGTTALNWESLRRGAMILRVHDVREAAEVVKIYNYYDKSQRPV